MEEQDENRWHKGGVLSYPNRRNNDHQGKAEKKVLAETTVSEAFDHCSLQGGCSFLGGNRTSLFLSRELVSKMRVRSAYLIHQHDLKSFGLLGLPY
jgi:hypothetical protein